MVLNYPKEGATDDDEWLDIAIPETFEVKIQDDIPKAIALEGME